MTDRTQHVIDAIDGALDDGSVSGDAMRWTPAPPASAAPPGPWLSADLWHTAQRADDDGTEFRRLSLNEWVEPTEPWLSADLWHAAQRADDDGTEFRRVVVTYPRRAGKSTWRRPRAAVGERHRDAARDAVDRLATMFDIDLTPWQRDAAADLLAEDFAAADAGLSRARQADTPSVEPFTP
jgi:hypothetical protein